MLTLFVFTSDDLSKHNPKAVIDSFGEGGVAKLVLLPSRRLDLEHDIETEWYGYVFSDERLDVALAKALPAFFASDHDYLTVIKLERVNGRPKASQAPRFFRKHVGLIEGTHFPKNVETLRGVRILDGLIRA